MIPNQQPLKPIPFRLAVIGEGPSEEDSLRNVPFASNSNQLLKSVLSGLGLPMDNLFLGYVSTRRASRSWETQSLESSAVQDGIRQLKTDLATFRPNCCLLLGDLALKVFGGKHTVYTDRGSIRYSNEFRCKYVSTHDSGAVMRNYLWLSFFKFDIVRAKAQSQFPEHAPPKRSLEVWPTFERLCDLLQGVLDRKTPIGFDLEGYPNQTGITCFSIATSKTSAFIVPLRNYDNTPFWPTIDQETEIWRLTALILSDLAITKVAQNAMYELFVFAWRHKILVRGLIHDTMFQMWEIFCELPKGLDTISSIFTEEPYYKDERTIQDLTVHHEYCCKDSLVTLESFESMDRGLTAGNANSKRHYEFNIRILKPYLYMSLRGCKLDNDLLADRRAKCWEKIQHQQAIVNEMTGMQFNAKSHIHKNRYLYKELNLPEQHKLEKGKKKLTSDFNALSKLYVNSQLPVLLEIAKLVRLRTRFSDLHKLQTMGDGRIRTNLNPVGTDTGRLSSSETWVEGLFNKPEIAYKKRKVDGVAISELCLSYKRTATNLGTNLQNVTKELRDLFVPDREDFLFWQYDLSGADAWTVAADLLALGNSRMMDHLNLGIKPSIVIVLLTEYGNDVYTWPIDHLKQVHDAYKSQVKTVPRLKNAYTAAKACQHGTNYGMQPPLMSSVLLQRSVAAWVDNFNAGIIDEIDFKITHPAIMERYQRLYSNYYGLELRNEYIRKQLSNHGYIDSANGHRRKFLAIRNRKKIDDSVVRQAAAHEPQANTTYATNRSLANMFYDLTNRTPRGSLRCEMLLMIHDALAGQAHESQQDWATEKMAEWFHVPLTIHGIELSIPVEGGWGKSWKATD